MKTHYLISALPELRNMVYAHPIDEIVSKSAEQLKRHEEPVAYDNSGLIYSHPQVRNEYLTLCLKRDHT
jgi:hypothetical protein